MSYDEYDAYRDEAEAALHEHCIPEDEVLQHVLDGYPDAIREAVDEDDAREWFGSGKPSLELLNIVSAYDREQLREAIRLGIGSEGQPRDERSPSQLFAVASEVAKFLESSHSPYAARYQVGDDLAWVAELIELTRAFRDLLLALAETEHLLASAPPAQNKLDRFTHILTLDPAKASVGKALEKLTTVLRQGIVFEIQIGRRMAKDEKTVPFTQAVSTELTPLHVSLALWMLEYLTRHKDFIQLAVCVECGRIFPRERRDNVYCSKTCQNRVAYKRKKIFESGVLREVAVDEGSLRVGLCLYHPRHGLGTIEAVSPPRRLLRVYQAKESSALAGLGGPQVIHVNSSYVVPISEGATPEQVVEELKKEGKQVDRWETQSVSLGISARVRFLPTVRVLSYWDLFGKKGENAVAFYSVENPAKLLQLV